MGKLSVIDIKELNALYLNVSSNVSEIGSWRYRVFESPEGRCLRTMLGRCLQHESMKIEVLEDLKISMQIALSYQRILISRRPYDLFWKDHLKEFNDRFNLAKNFLDSSLQAQITDVIDYLENFASQITLHLTDIVEEEIKKTPGKSLIIPETSRIGHLYQDWVNQFAPNGEVTILKNKGDIATSILQDYELAVFPGAPSRYLARQFFDTYLRSLLLSGISKKTVFISPSWCFTKSDLDISERLMPGLKIESLPEIVLDYTMSTENIETDSKIESWEIDMSYTKSQAYEQFEAGGTVQCRLISLGNDLVYPIEEDARRVTVLAKNIEKGIWELAFKDPFTELEPNDFLIACVGRSETQDLRERAARKMGIEFEKFVAQQAEWKTRLESHLNKSSIKNLEQSLLKAGVSKANRARHWIAPDAIQPAIKSDFVSLLEFLNFSTSEIARIVNSADEYDALLISEGREASKAISNALNEFEYNKLDRGESVEITLENFGDAIYLISPNQGVMPEELDCKPSQVRRVIQYQSAGIEL